MASPRRSAPERLLAWTYTGPVGHLWSVVADLAEFGVGVALTRMRKRLAQRSN